jgi:hypothetical protein
VLARLPAATVLARLPAAIVWASLPSVQVHLPAVRVSACLSAATVLASLPAAIVWASLLCPSTPACCQSICMPVSCLNTGHTYFPRFGT